MLEKMIRLAAGLSGAAAAGAVLLVGFAGVASAAAFTLESPIAFANDSGSEVYGTIRPVEDLSGSLEDQSGNIGTGPSDFTGVDVFVVDIVLDVGSASVGGVGIGMGLFDTGEPIGAGSFDDSGIGRQDTSDVAHSAGFTQRADFEFLTNPNQLTGGETSARLFVTYSSGFLSEGLSASFMISSGTDFSVSGAIIPEPSTALLMGLGLLGLGLGGKKRRK